MKRADADTIPATSELQRELDAQRALVERLTAELAAREAQWAAEKRSLFEQLRVLIEQRFGPSTERYRLSQRDLFFDEAETLAEGEHADDAEAPSESVPGARRRRRGGRAPLPPELPRVDVIHDLAAAERVCAADGQALVCIGEVVSEQLDIIPARVQVIRHVRRQYACRACEAGVHTAALPPQPAAPQQRQPGAARLRRHRQVPGRAAALPPGAGLPSPRPGAAAPDAGALDGAARRAGGPIGCRAAPPCAHRRAHPHGRDHRAGEHRARPRPEQSLVHVGVQRGGPPQAEAVVFDYAPSRLAQVPQRLLGDYRGVLLTDGYEGYAAVVRANGLTHAGCWAHARRKFVEADKAQRRGGKAAWALKQIGALYRIERDIRHDPVAERERRRARDSRPVVDALHTWLEIQLERVPPKTALGKALHYLHAQ